MNAIDTNIFVYALDPSALVKRVKAEQLVDDLIKQGGGTLLIWQVAVELLAALRKAEAKGVITADRVEEAFYHVLNLFPISYPTTIVFDRSFSLKRRFSLSHWDSLLVAACQESDVTRLYSEDMQHGACYDTVTIVNPFV